MDKQLIENQLTKSGRQMLQAIHVYDEIDSTNLEAFRLLDSGNHGNHLVVADAQSAGRGRRGRTWHSPAGGGLYMSLLHHFSSGSAQLQGLSLVTALTVHSVL
ncbi:MAG: bifunctional biotin--[acetyl-CoA-carboxylase] synthetase/biotin operon repressor, partial [Pseudomonadales bacterium]|nr:bifunctional biotin--[acetyl-CoA-carboxylase] synthetase/biotin operon repressor [Pseudomonadales bacterium]